MRVVAVVSLLLAVACGGATPVDEDDPCGRMRACAASPLDTESRLCPHSAATECGPFYKSWIRCRYPVDRCPEVDLSDQCQAEYDEWQACRFR